MLVPTEKLIFWTGAILVPSALILTVSPAWSPAIVILILAAAVALAVDAVRAGGILVGATAVFPDVIRLTKDRETGLEFHIDSAQALPRMLRLGLDLPQTIRSSQESMDLSIPAHTAKAMVKWPCTPTERGSYALKNVYAEVSSPWGLWALRHTLRGQTEIRVYPNLRLEHRRVSALFLDRGAFGIHAQRQIGKGRDFEQLRDYIPGDSYEDIHWKATARRGYPVTKVFQMERTQEVYTIIDSARFSGRATQSADGKDTTQLEQYINSALIMGLAAERQGDHFGLITFSDKVERFIRARHGAAHFNGCRDALFSLESHNVNPDFGEAGVFIRERLTRRALLVFLTNLDDQSMAERFVANVELIARSHLVLVAMMTPPGVQPLFSQEAHSTDEIYEHLSGHLRWHHWKSVGYSLSPFWHGRQYPFRSRCN